jgi:ABC-type Na+ transport system ATPase subunit NatA
MESPAIQIARLNRSFGELHAVRNLDLEVPQGAVYGFLGPNGAGKTTTIRLMLGLLRPDSGEVRIFGSSFQSHRVALLRRIGSMIESPSLYPHLTARENLETKRRIIMAPRTEIDRVLGVVDLRGSADRLVRDFSQGMAQRLAIAQAMLGAPELLVLDEPTNGLDPAGIADMRSLIRDLPKASSVSILMHDNVTGRFYCRYRYPTLAAGLNSEPIWLDKNAFVVRRLRSLSMPLALDPGDYPAWVESRYAATRKLPIACSTAPSAPCAPGATACPSTTMPRS